MNSSRLRPFPPDNELPKIDGGITEASYCFKTITPVFGAGVKAGVIDEVTPLRGTTVRGHLRFWWRVVCGRHFTKLEHLRDREAKLWGLASKPGLVQIAVSLVSGVKDHCGSAGHFRPNYPPYALFPFKNTEVPAKFHIVWKSLSFTLLVRAGDAANEVEAALWAWANFGGIGSRTRRGCGALFCPQFAPTGIPDKTWVSTRLTAFGVPHSEPTWPQLTREPILGKAQAPVTAWEHAVKALADFRQNAPVGRNAPFKRSHWPEADSLRARSGAGDRNHMKSITIDARSMPAFPRAELGLPYQVDFKEGPDTANNVQVFPDHSKRFASPVIVRPLALGPRGERAVPMALRLDGPLPARVRVEPNDRPTFRVQPVVRHPALALYPESPLAGRSVEGSALEAFLAFAGEKFK